ncbi:type II secretion system protein [Sulfurospirillum sp. 1307]
MRKGLTLIELIFTIVIIAIVFTVIPKIVFALNKADSFIIRQDAMFNGFSMIKMISNMPWDENNINSADILHVTKSDCNSSTDNYRVGGFVGSRTCEDNLSASLDFNDSDEDKDTYDDIDDFNNSDYNTTSKGNLRYGLHVEVKYINDEIAYTSSNAKLDLNKSEVSPTTNLKYVDINVTYKGSRGNQGKQLTQFNYTSANIGQMILHKRVWK